MGRTWFIWLLGILLSGSLSLAALADPPAAEPSAEAPPTETPQPAEQPPADQGEKAPPKEETQPEEAKPADNEQPSKEQQPEEGHPAKPSDEKPSDEKKSDEKKSDEKKSDEKKSDGKKSDGKKSDGKKSDGKKSDGKKSEQPAPKPEPRRVEWNDEISAVLEKTSPESLDDLRLIQKQLQRVVDAATPATVSVRVGNSFGSGVIVSPDGLVLTAGHVVGQPNVDVTFIFPDGKTAKGKTLGMNQQIDSGMMKITDSGPWPFVEVGKSGDIKGGQWVVAIGQPGGFDGERSPPVRLGRVLFANGDVINTDCTLVGGDSGGPLFNMKGEVIGIHSRIGRRITNNYHVPISTYHETWDRLAAAESWGNRLGGAEPVRSWPMLGIAGRRGVDRCELTQVYPNRPAAAAGLKVGDIITSFDGKSVKSFEHLGQLVAEQKPLATVEVELKRGDETVKLKVRLGMTNRRIPGSYNDDTKPS